MDMHEPLLPEVVEKLFGMRDDGLIHNMIFNNHNRLYNGAPIRQWQDVNYLHALISCKAKYLAHFDADSSAFRRDDCTIIDQWISLIESGAYKYVSYPTFFSPNEGDVPGENALTSDGTGYDYLWTSTRFFFCKRSEIDYNRIFKCFDDEFWIQTHNGRKYRYPNVMEQILGFLAGPNRVCYSPKRLEEFMIFCWHDYYKGTIGKLNEMPYEQVYDFIMNECGGIGGACDVNQKGKMSCLNQE